MNVLNTLKSHWKKSFVFAAGGACGVSYANNKWKDWKLMQAYCLEAKKYGDVTLKSSFRPKRVTVILNPAANKGKGKSIYEKTVAPILHLAGMEVNLFETQYEGHAKKLIADLDKTDAVIIAGGDGTLSEAITGFLRRSDEAKLSSTIPWCIIPIGKTNSLAHSLYLPSTKNQIQFIAEMALSSVAGPVTPVDVMHIKGDDGKPVYAVSNLSFGAFTDSEIRKKKNWYFGPLRNYLCYVITTISHWSGFVKCEMSFSYLCSGCSKCKSPQKLQWSWWHIFMRPKHEPTKDYADIHNPLCQEIFKINGKPFQLDVMANRNVLVNNSNNDDSKKELEEGKFIEVQTVGGTVNKKDFIEKGWERVRSFKENRLPTSEPILKVGSFKLEIPDTQTEGKMLIIDNEEFEANKTLAVQLLANKLKFYYCPMMTVSSTSV